jgi:hypothetical protein
MDPDCECQLRKEVGGCHRLHPQPSILSSLTQLVIHPQPSIVFSLTWVEGAVCVWCMTCANDTSTSHHLLWTVDASVVAIYNYDLSSSYISFKAEVTMSAGHHAIIAIIGERYFPLNNIHIGFSRKCPVTFLKHATSPVKQSGEFFN